MALPELPVEVAIALEDELADTAVVYGRDATSGRWSVVLNAALPCRVSIPRTRLATTAESRIQLAALRELYWTANYAMPNDARLAINGESPVWSVVPGTVRRVRQADGGLAHWTCDLAGTGRAPQGSPR